MYVADVVPADVAAELADGLDEGDDLDVAHRAADLDDHHVDVLVLQPADPVLDLVGDVRDHLDRAAEEVAPALLLDHGPVDAARGRVRALGEVLVDEALVVPEVEVGLAAVLGDEDLAVLAGVHRPRVDVDVRVELAHRHPESPALEEPTERGGGETLPERARDAARDEDELAHATFVAPRAFIAPMARAFDGAPPHVNRRRRARWWRPAHQARREARARGRGRRRCADGPRACATARSPAPRPSPPSPR